MKEQISNISPFGLRIQSDLKNRIAQKAKENKVSLNAEITSTLEKAYPKVTLLEQMAKLNALSKILIQATEPKDILNVAKLQYDTLYEEIIKDRPETPDIDHIIEKYMRNR